MSLERRVTFRAGLSSLYLPYYDALCLALGPEWQPYMGLRSFSQQDALWKQGRQVPGPNPTDKHPLGGVVTNARGGESAHNYGCGTDWAYFQDGVLQWITKDSPHWKVFQAAVEGVGLRWGGEFGDVDHAEIKISCDWKHVLLEFNTHGSRSAQEYIQERIVKLITSSQTVT